MPATVRSLDDLILDGIVSVLAAKSAADAAVSTALAFAVTRGKTAPWQDLSVPLVNVTLESDNPEGRDYTASYAVDYLVPTLDDDETADKRALYLKEQIRSALLAFKDYDLGQSLGSVSRTKAPAFTARDFDDGDMNKTIKAGRWTLEVRYAYKPEEPTLPALSIAQITVDRWSALYNL